MADDTEGESWSPEDDEPKISESDQKALKLELMKLNEAATGVVAPVAMTPLTAAQIEALNKNIKPVAPVATEKPVDAPTSPAEKPVENQTPPEEAIVQSPDVPQLNQPNYDIKPDAKIRELSTNAKPGRTFSPEVERSLDMVAKMYPSIPRDVLAGFVQVESSGDPKANIGKATQYKGLLQIGREEWQKHGGGGDIYDAEQNLKGGASLMEKNRQDFIRAFGREPTPAQLYLIHQQGLGFYTNGTTTNLIGNLPPNARTPENLTHDGFERWWTARIERAIKERGTAPSMTKVADSNLPAGYLYPGPFADIGGGPLTQGGGNQTPAEQAMTADLMHKSPLALRAGTERAAYEAAARGAKNPWAKTEVSQKVPLSREQQQVPGVIPGSVSHTDTMPIPGIMTPGEELLNLASNPSVFSTIQNYQAMQPVAPPRRPEEMRAAPTFIDKLMNVVKGFAPAGSAGTDMKNQAVADLQGNPLPNRSIPDWLRELSKFDQEFTSGAVAGVQHMPTDILGSVAGGALGLGGLLTGSDKAKAAGMQIQSEAEAFRENRQKAYGIDPANPTQAQAIGNLLGSNAATSLPGFALNTGLGLLGSQVLGPASAYMAKNFPVPDLSPVSSANAASVWGKPPVIYQTPGGPVVMNDASVQGMVWGAGLSLGFGAGLAHAGPVARYIVESKPFGWSGMYDLFDPRRAVPGAPGTVAASRPIDILKGGIVDRTQAMLDIADRQTRYEKGTRVGIDPIAADAVRQKWRFQTGSGAQNLITQAIKGGKLATDDFRFDVPVSIGQLHEFSQVKTQFPEYLKLKILQDELTFQKTARDKLPQQSQKRTKYPSVYKDSFDNVWDLPKVNRALQTMEHDSPDFVQAHRDYLKNLEETRNFVSGTHNNGVENFQSLTDAAIKKPSVPIFSDRANSSQIVQDVLGGVNPLNLAENGMRKAMANQMKVDAEAHYRDISMKDAFTPRTSRWVKNRSGTAIQEGAVLRRKIGGKTQYWTADPLIVSMMNADTVPLQGWGRAAAKAKDIFQATTTGGFAPHFAMTGMIRAMEQGWATAPMGVKDASGRTRVAAGPISTTAAIAQQIAPRALHLMSPTVAWFEGIIQNSDLGQKFIDPKYHNIMSRVMEQAYNNSFYKLMLDNGAYTGKTLQQDYVTHANITAAKLRNQNKAVAPIYDFMEKSLGVWGKYAGQAIKGTGKGIMGTGKAINESLRSVQEAPGFAWARKVGEGGSINGRTMSNAELAARMRNYTGDPSTRGFIYSTGFRGNPETLRYSGPGQKQADAYKFIGQLAHGARVSTPWAGVLLQSPASTIRAMRDNPVRANLAFTASHVLPEIVAYLWNTYHSSPENDYVGYMMDGRGNNPLLNNTYFAVPGQKPEDGIEFRHYQEGILQRYMARAFMQQYYGRSMHNMWEDTQEALRGFLGGAIMPPQPSWLNAMYGMNNMVAPEGFLGGVYKRRTNPFVTLGGGENWIELTLRALAPSITDMAIQAHQAGLYAPTWGDVPAAATKQVGERILGRTAVIGDVLGYKPSYAGSTAISEEFWRRRNTIEDLTNRYAIWDKNEGAVKFKDASIGGGAHAGPFLPKRPNVTKDNFVPNPGMSQPDPINPLYTKMMQVMEDTFKKDDPAKGGIGYKTMWKHYMGYGALASRLNTVNEGNTAAWRDSQTKSERAELIENGADPNSYKSVKNYYNARRNEVAKVMLRTILATEQKISQIPEVKAMLKGKPFTINMLDPNKVGIESPEDVEEYPHD